jgi:Mn2+/Fe2+ NRAMP family transporter
MNQKAFSIVAGVIFAVVALFHLVRIYMDWPVTIGDWSIPMWASWIALVVAGVLAFLGLRLAVLKRSSGRT